MTLQIPSPRWFVVLFCLLVTSQAFALSSGISGHSGRDPANTCIKSGCHSGGQVPQVALEGPESVEAGTQTTLFLRISGGQQNLVGYGVSLPVDGGFDEQTHSSPIVAGTTEQVIEITWNVPSVDGTYTIYAFGLSADGANFAMGDNGAAATITVEVTAAAGIQRPAVVISVPASAAPGDTITIDGSGTVHPNAQSTFSRFLWDFGDGSTPQSSDASPSITHTYNTAGNYTVTLAVTDDAGITGVTFKNISITDNAEVLRGETLYNGNCSSCHGSNGGGGNAPAITGTLEEISASIAAALTRAPMDTIGITAQADIDAMAAFLVNVGGGEPEPRPTDGRGLYERFCGGCHGADGGGASAKRVTGSGLGYIQVAIRDVPEMDVPSVTTMTTAELELVARYLSAGGPPEAIPTDSAGLYEVFCSTCHGDGGHGGTRKAVTGSAWQFIRDAIASQNAVPLMTELLVSNEQLQDISDYLVNGGNLGATNNLPSSGVGLYDIFCAVCHGAGGLGSTYKVVTGASQSFINNALSRLTYMTPLDPVLSNTQVGIIAGYLAGGGDGPNPTD
jgi:mono/diheme cytochrome c family protein